MAGRLEISTGIIALACLLALISLLSPWWTVEMGGIESAGPFNANDGLISDQSALVSGALTLLGLVLLATSAVLLVYGLAGQRTGFIANAPLVALGGSAVVALALVLAIFTYPSEFADLGVSFWGGDVDSGMSTGFKRADAAVGWFVGIGAVVLGTIGGGLAMLDKTAMVKGQKTDQTEA